MLPPKKTTFEAPSNALEVLTANMISLQLKSKLFHLNVTGPRFYGDHKTYDGIYAVAEEWFDILAERMRALGLQVKSTPEWVVEHDMLRAEDINEDSPAEEMAYYMLQCLQMLSKYINANLDNFDETTISIVQDLDAAIGKQIYFVRSSI